MIRANKTEMFSLFYGLWKYIFSKTEFHVLILGIDKAGKTVMSLSYLLGFKINLLLVPGR